MCQGYESSEELLTAGIDNGDQQQASAEAPARGDDLDNTFQRAIRRALLCAGKLNPIPSQLPHPEQESGQ